jgi:2-oxoglutarate-Fe(II)-dependent oxygenase superfamily protein
MGFQINRRGVELPAGPESEHWRRQFAARHCIQIPGFLSPDLLSWLRGRLDASRFEPEVHMDTYPPAMNLQLADDALQLEIRTLLNDTRLFGAVEDIAGSGPVGCCVTHVYMLDASPDSRDSWHGDVDGNRMVAISINAGGAYEGGVLQIRERASERIVHEVANTGDGSAVLFRIRDDLQHYVTPLVRGRRVAVAGWFQKTPAARELLRLPRAIPHP